MQQELWNCYITPILAYPRLSSTPLPRKRHH